MPIAQVWTEEGSPLAAITARQAKALQRARSATGVDRRSCDALRQARRSRERIDALKAAGCDAHPARAALSAILRGDDGDRQRRGLRRARARCAGSRRCARCRLITTIPLYIEALQGERRGGSSPRSISSRERLLLSFHGMPQRTLELGDPYHCHCQKTARLLGEALGRELDVAFQSRFGRAKWLEPATDAMLAGLPGARASQRVAIAAPGFSADCLETLEELAIRGRETFLARRRQRISPARLPQRFSRRASTMLRAAGRPRT